MLIKDMFLKPIDRDIKGVVKVGQDDTSVMKQELEEYVVTNELQKHFRDFFASYKKGINRRADKMGVWISVSSAVVNLTFLKYYPISWKTDSRQ